MKFDAYSYFENICNKFRLTKGGKYKYCRVTGLSNLEEVIQNMQKENAFFCIDDTNDGYTYKSGSGYFDRRMYIVYILKKYKFGDMQAQHVALQECRAIYDGIVSRLIKDKSELMVQKAFPDYSRIPYYEFEGYAIAGCTGLYMMLTVDEPKSLCYNVNDWDE